MEIQKKITLQFTGIVAILIAISLLLIYLLFASIRKEDFKERLNNKALSIAQLIAETDQLEPELIKRIEKNNPTSLPKERIVVFNESGEIIYTSDTNGEIPDNYREMISVIRKSNVLYLKKGKNEMTGHYYSGNKENVIVICSANDVFGFRKLKSLRIILIAVFLLSNFLIFFLGRVFASKALNPISDIVQQVNNIDSNNLQQRVSAGSGKDEMSLLADTFNDMLERLEIAFKAQKDFIANASHELRTPLTSITGSLEVTLLNDRSNLEYKQALLSTLEEVKSLNQLTNSLLTLLHTDATSTDSTFEEMRIDDILWKTRSEYLKNHKNNVIEISFDDSIQGEDSFKLFGNHELLKTAFFNLIDNGCKYSSNNKTDIHLAIINQNLQITFNDNGIGIPENEIDNIMQPFYRASNVENRNGHGIGLSLVDRIISMHNGAFFIDSTINQGTTITLTLPLTNNF